MTFTRFADVVSLSTSRLADPAAAGIERFVGLEHITPENLHIRSWGLVADGTTFTSHFKPGQVLFGKRRAYQRKVAVADFEGICSSDIYVFESKDPNVLLPELLPFICQSEGFFEYAVKTSAGSLSPRTNWSHLANYEFPLPPVDEQRRIADLLWAADDTSQKYLGLLESLNQMIQVYENAIWGTKLDSSQAWRNLSAHPNDWRQLALQNTCIKIQDGTHFSPKSNGGNYRYVTSKNIKDGYLDLSDCGWISADEHDPIYRRVDVKLGDVLLTKDGANTGNVAMNILNEPFSLLSSVVMIRTEPSRLLNQYLFYYLHSRFGRVKVTSQMKGSAITRITLQQVKKMGIPTPSLSDQGIIVETFKKFYETREQLLQTMENLSKQNRLFLNSLLGQ
jgi:type I restriction enzyme S subunit